MTLRLPPLLAKVLKRMAKQRGMYLNDFLCQEIEKQVTKDELSSRMSGVRRDPSLA